ncbi:MAG: heavy metal-binding domain-containing protein, partial [Casimicrobiaceae bacterium]
MHPQIVRDGPGVCPICGMALEPRTATTGERPNPQLADMTRRFWAGVVLAIPILLLGASVFNLDLPPHAWLSPRGRVWLTFALASPVVLWGGKPFFQRGWASLVHRN